MCSYERGITIPCVPPEILRDSCTNLQPRKREALALLCTHTHIFGMGQGRRSQSPGPQRSPSPYSSHGISREELEVRLAKLTANMQESIESRRERERQARMERRAASCPSPSRDTSPVQRRPPPPRGAADTKHAESNDGDADLRARLRPIFNKFDIDRSGAVSTAEMAAIIKAMKVEMTLAQTKEMMQEADPDGRCVCRSLFASTSSRDPSRLLHDQSSTFEWPHCLTPLRSPPTLHPPPFEWVQRRGRLRGVPGSDA